MASKGTGFGKRHLAEQFTFPWYKVVDNMRTTIEQRRTMGKPRLRSQSCEQLELIFVPAGQSRADFLDLSTDLNNS